MDINYMMYMVEKHGDYKAINTREAKINHIINTIKDIKDIKDTDIDIYDIIENLCIECGLEDLTDEEFRTIIQKTISIN